MPDPERNTEEFWRSYEEVQEAEKIYARMRARRHHITERMNTLEKTLGENKRKLHYQCVHRDHEGNSTVQKYCTNQLICRVCRTVWTQQEY